MTVYATVDLRVIEDAEEIRKANSPKGKVFLRLTFDDGRTFDMTLNLAEMIGGAASGTSKRMGYQ